MKNKLYHDAIKTHPVLSQNKSNGATQKLGFGTLTLALNLTAALSFSQTPAKAATSATTVETAPTTAVDTTTETPVDTAAVTPAVAQYISQLTALAAQSNQLTANELMNQTAEIMSALQAQYGSSQAAAAALNGNQAYQDALNTINQATKNGQTAVDSALQTLTESLTAPATTDQEKQALKDMVAQAKATLENVSQNTAGQSANQALINEATQNAADKTGGATLTIKYVNPLTGETVRTDQVLGPYTTGETVDMTPYLSQTIGANQLVSTPSSSQTMLGANNVVELFYFPSNESVTVHYIDQDSQQDLKTKQISATDLTDLKTAIGDTGIPGYTLVNVPGDTNDSTNIYLYYKATKPAATDQSSAAGSSTTATGSHQHQSRPDTNTTAAETNDPATTQDTDTTETALQKDTDDAVSTNTADGASSTDGHATNTSAASTSVQSATGTTQAQTSSNTAESSSATAANATTSQPQGDLAEKSLLTGQSAAPDDGSDDLLTGSASNNTATAAKNNQQAALPQTGESQENTSLSLLGALLIFLGGLVGLRKRQNN